MWSSGPASQQPIVVTNISIPSGGVIAITPANGLPTTGANGIRITCPGFSGRVVVFLDFLSDVTLTTQISQYSIELSKANTAMDITFPIDGPICEVDIAVPGGSTVTGSIFVSLVQTPVVRPTSAFLPLPGANFLNFSSVPANTVITQNVPNIVPGEAFLYCCDEDFSGKCIFTIEQYNTGVLQNRIAQARFITSPFHLSVQLPLATVAVRIQNTDTVAHTVSYALVQMGT